MTAAWLHAGVQHVLSSPALVADEVACEALARWHGLVAGRRRPGRAWPTSGGAAQRPAAAVPGLRPGLVKKVRRARISAHPPLS